jgi:hypothetical protein
MHNLEGDPEGKTTFVKPTCRWDENIRMDLQEIWRDTIQTAFNRLSIRFRGGKFFSN